MDGNRRNQRWRKLAGIVLLGFLAADCLALVWAGWAWSWIAQRRELLQSCRVAVRRITFLELDTTTAPMGLWLFGEDGAKKVYCSEPDAREARRLFPEADVEVDGVLLLDPMDLP